MPLLTVFPIGNIVYWKYYTYEPAGGGHVIGRAHSRTRVKATMARAHTSEKPAIRMSNYAIRLSLVQSVSFKFNGCIYFAYFAQRVD